MPNILAYLPTIYHYHMTTRSTMWEHLFYLLLCSHFKILSHLTHTFRYTLLFWHTIIYVSQHGSFTHTQIPQVNFFIFPTHSVTHTALSSLMTSQASITCLHLQTSLMLKFIHSYIWIIQIILKAVRSLTLSFFLMERAIYLKSHLNKSHKSLQMSVG